MLNWCWKTKYCLTDVENYWIHNVTQFKIITGKIIIKVNCKIISLFVIKYIFIYIYLCLKLTDFDEILTQHEIKYSNLLSSMGQLK